MTFLLILFCPSCVCFLFILFEWNTRCLTHAWFLKTVREYLFKQFEALQIPFTDISTYLRSTEGHCESVRFILYSADTAKPWVPEVSPPGELGPKWQVAGVWERGDRELLTVKWAELGTKSHLCVRLNEVGNGRSDEKMFQGQTAWFSSSVTEEVKAIWSKLRFSCLYAYKGRSGKSDANNLPESCGDDGPSLRFSHAGTKRYRRSYLLLATSLPRFRKWLKASSKNELVKSLRCRIDRWFLSRWSACRNLNLAKFVRNLSCDVSQMEMLEFNGMPTPLISYSAMIPRLGILPRKSFVGFSYCKFVFIPHSCSVTNQFWSTITTTCTI